MAAAHRSDPSPTDFETLVDVREQSILPGMGTYLLAEQTIDAKLRMPNVWANHVTFSPEGDEVVTFSPKASDMRVYVQLDKKTTGAQVCMTENDCVEYSKPAAIAIEDELEVSRSRLVVRVVAQGSVPKEVKATGGLLVRVRQRRKRESYDHILKPSREGMLPLGTMQEVRGR